MDIFFTSLLSLIILFVSSTLHFLLYKPKSPELGTPLPAGGKGWPVIGESLEFLATGWKGHPEKFIFDRMSKYSPIVFKTSLMLEDFAVLCGAQGNKFFFSNENKLVQIWWPASVRKIVLPSTNNKSYKTETVKFRKLLPNFFRTEALQRYVPIMDVITQRHFAEEWDGRKEVVTNKLTRNLTFWVACKIFVSIDDPKKVRYLSAPFETMITGIISVPIDLPGTPFRRGTNASNFIRKNLISIVNQRKVDLDNASATPTQDILSHMILFRDEDGQSMEANEIADRILVLLIVGQDTLSSAIACVVKYLAELPQIYDGVYKEQMEIANSKPPGELLNWEDLSKMKYSWKVACEVLRLAPPLLGSFREAITDFTYNGYSIPRGWKLYWSAGATHKNPEFFPEPENFDPSRFEGNGPAPYAYVPFGRGPHMCPGKEYARVEILVFMHHLVRKFKWEKMIPDEQIIYSPRPSQSKGLPIRIYPHKA